MEVLLHSFSASALDGGEWSASRPGRFAPGEITQNTHWIGGWVGPRAGPDAVAKRKVPVPAQKPNCGDTTRSPIIIIVIIIIIIIIIIKREPMFLRK
jgi:hypothetical protein